MPGFWDKFTESATSTYRMLEQEERLKKQEAREDRRDREAQEDRRVKKDAAEQTKRILSGEQKVSTDPATQRVDPTKISDEYMAGQGISTPGIPTVAPPGARMTGLPAGNAGAFSTEEARVNTGLQIGAQRDMSQA